MRPKAYRTVKLKWYSPNKNPNSLAGWKERRAVSGYLEKKKKEKHHPAQKIKNGLISKNISGL